MSAVDQCRVPLQSGYDPVWAGKTFRTPSSLGRVLSATITADGDLLVSIQERVNKTEPPSYYLVRIPNKEAYNIFFKRAMSKLIDEAIGE